MLFGYDNTVFIDVVHICVVYIVVVNCYDRMISFSRNILQVFFFTDFIFYYIFIPVSPALKQKRRQGKLAITMITFDAPYMSGTCCRAFLIKEIDLKGTIPPSLYMKMMRPVKA